MILVNKYKLKNGVYKRIIKSLDVMQDPPTITLKKETAVHILAFFAILVFPISPVLCQNMELKSPLILQKDSLDRSLQIPAYPQAVLVDSQIIRGEKVPKYQEEWSTSDSVPLVMSWYVEALKKDGWSIEQVPADPTAPLTQLVSAKKDDIILYVSVIRNQNESLTRIAIESYSSEMLEEEDEADETVTDIPQ